MCMPTYCAILYYIPGHCAYKYIMQKNLSDKIVSLLASNYMCRRMRVPSCVFLRHGFMQLRLTSICLQLLIFLCLPSA